MRIGPTCTHILDILNQTSRRQKIKTIKEICDKGVGAELFSEPRLTYRYPNNIYAFYDILCNHGKLCTTQSLNTKITVKRSFP